MIQNSFLLAIFLILIETGVIALSLRFKKYFEVLPAVFWIYFLPMIFSTAGIIPNDHVLYSTISKYVLPASLFLLLIGVNLPAILKLGKTAIVVMLAGSLGIVLGAPIVILLFKPWLPENAWMGFAALSGSWTGGSANMIAVKEALSIPDSAFLPMVVVDVIVAYSWMGILIALRAYESKFNQWNKSDEKVVYELKTRATASPQTPPPPRKRMRWWGVLIPPVLILYFAFKATFISVFSSKFIPASPHLSNSTWVIIIISTLALILSFTPLRKLEEKGTSKIGYLLLYFVLTSIGAKANLTHILSAPILILAGFVWVGIHFAFLLLAARLTRAPLSLVATASQANIGGPVSAPIVAAVYEPSLAPVGLLLGILGNVIGTYLGLICFQLCLLVK